MKIDLTTLLNGRVSHIDFVEEIQIEENSQEQSMMPNHVQIIRPIKVSGSIENNQGYMSMDASILVEYITKCDRCLDELTKQYEIPFHRLVSMPGKTGLLTEESGVDPDELLEANDSYLDASAAIVEEVALEMPNYHLCSPSCPGLCPTCGKNLKEGPCGCVKKKEIDPRLAILQKLLDNSEDA